ncbi:MAG: hypothetical protein AAGI71_02690 [Bacteroidota bacterium]
MLPAMIGALVAVLEGYPALWFVPLPPAAMGLAAGWSVYSLQRLPARIYVAGGAVAVQSAWEAAPPSQPLTWDPLFDLRKTRTTVEVTVGLIPYALHDAEWPEMERLLPALKEALDLRKQTPWPPR